MKIIRCVLCSCLILHSLAAEHIDRLQEHIRVSIALLSDERPGMHKQGVRDLRVIGSPCLPDLKLLATDKDALLRLRVAKVAGAISHDEALDILSGLADDQIVLIREAVALGLAIQHPDRAFPQLAKLLHDDDRSVRSAAALGLGSIGNPLGLGILLRQITRERNLKTTDNTERKARNQASLNMIEALRHLLKHPRTANEAISLMANLKRDELRILTLQTWEIGDPRYAPPLLAALTKHVDDEELRYLCAMSLSANGDSRCIGPLCQLVSSLPAGRVREAIARALRRLTGIQAGSGKAWKIWWDSHHEQVEKRHARDELIALLHDPDLSPRRSDLERFSPAELMPLLDGFIGRGAKHWPERAWLALQIDDPNRWVRFSLQALPYEPNEMRRIGMITLIDILGKDNGRQGLRIYRQHAGSLSSSERAALNLAIDKIPLTE